MKADLNFAGFILSATVLAAQGVPGGSINGKAIPNRVFADARELAVSKFVASHQHTPNGAAEQQEVDRTIQSIRCDRLRSAIVSEARAEQLRQMGITVSSVDIDNVRKTMPPVDPAADAHKLNERAASLLQALNAVDHGQATDDAYTTFAKPHGITPEEWSVQLQQWHSPGGKAALARQLAVTPEAAAKALAAVDLRPLAEARKLDQAVDSRLASADRAFAEYLAERDKASQDPDPRKQWMNQQHQQYLEQKRAEWWRNQISKLHVVLNDPRLATTCKLQQELGATVQ
jgi:hypothetical protein